MGGRKMDRQKALRTAKDLGYSKETLDAIRSAETDAQIDHILTTARVRNRDAEDKVQFDRLGKMMFDSRYRGGKRL